MGTAWLWEGRGGAGVVRRKPLPRPGQRSLLRFKGSRQTDAHVRYREVLCQMLPVRGEQATRALAIGNEFFKDSAGNRVKIMKVDDGFRNGDGRHRRGQ